MYFVALLLVGAASMMTAGAQGAGNKPTLAVFVVGGDNGTLDNMLASQIGAELNRNSRYTVLPSTNTVVQAKLTELRAQGAGNIDRNVLAEWGRTNGVATICLVTDAIKGNGHMFYAHLIDAKDSKVSGRGNYIRTNDLPRVSLALSRQLDGSGRRRSTPAPVRNYPAELDIEMVFVEGGTFTMGCVPERDGNCQSDETPTRQVQLSSFYIGKYEVTVAQWNAVMKGHPLEVMNPSEDQTPVVTSWMKIDTAFLPRLNTLTGRTTTATKYRLPTAAEWEYAARGCSGDGGVGVATCEAFAYSGSNNYNEVGWFTGSKAVGQKKPNRLSIYDMSGNAWEWCWDRYNASYYSTLSASGVTVNPTGPTADAVRTMRGGSYYPADNILFRVAARRAAVATGADGTTGFRIVLPAQ
jgi:formylglycine-generating enzyme required for sulfatase activity